MPTYFAGSTLDALVPSLTDCRDDANNVYVGGSAGFADAYVTDPTDGQRKGVTRLWSHVGSYSAAYGPSNGLVLYSWLDAAGNEVVRFPQMPGGRAFQIFQGGQWVTLGQPQSSSDGVYDFLIVVHPTAGRLAWFFNGNLAVDLRNIDTSAIGNVARFRLRRLQDYVGNTSHSGILLASYNTIGHTVRRRAPNANGSRMTWSGSYQDVAEASNDDTTAISASDVGDLATFKAAAFTPTSQGNVIKAVAIAARIRNDGDVIPTNARALVTVNGRDYQAPANLPITAGFAGSVSIFEADPTTGAAWKDIANVNGEFGLLAIE